MVYPPGTLSLSLRYMLMLTYVDDSVPSYRQVGGVAFTGRPATPPRRSHDWTSSDLRGQTWAGDLIPQFSSDDINLSPQKNRYAELPRSTSPYHSLQETRHRQAT